MYSLHRLEEVEPSCSSRLYLFVTRHRVVALAFSASRSSGPTFSSTFRRSFWGCCCSSSTARRCEPSGSGSGSAACRFQSSAGCSSTCSIKKTPHSAGRLSMLVPHPLKRFRDAPRAARRPRPLAPLAPSIDKLLQRTWGRWLGSSAGASAVWARRLAAAARRNWWHGCCRRAQRSHSTQ